MSEPSANRVAPVAGAGSAVPWPTPPIPGTSMLTFWGIGDQTTEAFELPGNASMRIVAELGPLTVRVLNPDGTDGAKPAAATAGLTLGAIPKGGMYTLDVRASGRWGVTVVFETPT